MRKTASVVAHVLRLRRIWAALLVDFGFGRGLEPVFPVTAHVLRLRRVD
jgi:hypothetical protein